MALAEGVGNPRHGLAQKGRGRLAIGDASGDLAQPVHVVDENDEPAWAAVRGAVGVGFLEDLAKDMKGVLHVSGTQHLAHRAEMRQARGAEAAFEDYRALGRIAADPLGEAARLFIRPKVQFRSLSHQPRCLTRIALPVLPHQYCRTRTALTGAPVE